MYFNVKEGGELVRNIRGQIEHIYGSREARDKGILRISRSFSGKILQLRCTVTGTEYVRPSKVCKTEPDSRYMEAEEATVITV